MRAPIGEDVLVVPGEGYHSLQLMSGMFMGWDLNPWDYPVWVSHILTVLTPRRMS